MPLVRIKNTQHLNYLKEEYNIDGKFNMLINFPRNRVCHDNNHDYKLTIVDPKNDIVFCNCSTYRSYNVKEIYHKKENKEFLGFAECFNSNMNICNCFYFAYSKYLVVGDIQKEIETVVKNNKKLFLPILKILQHQFDIENFEKLFKDKHKPYSVFIGNMLYIILRLIDKPNLAVWLCKNVYNYNIDMFNADKIITWIENYGKLANKLSKSTLQAYNSATDFILLMSEISMLSYQQMSNIVINTFNTFQKKILKTYEFSQYDYFIIKKFSRLSVEKKLNFIKKVSSFDSSQEIMQLLEKIVLVDFIWEKNSVIECINDEQTNAIILYDKDNYLIVEVKDYPTINKLAKSTNWCISKQKIYWNDYVASKKSYVKQLLIYDFSKKEDDILSLVGVTVSSYQGITHAHSFVNDNLFTPPSLVNVKHTLKPFYDIPMYNITSVMNKIGIDINQVVACANLPFKWNADSFIKYLEDKSLINQTKFYYNKENKIICRINNVYNTQIFGDDFYSSFEVNGYDYEEDFIYILDFNKKESDCNKAIIGGISRDENNQYEYIETFINLWGDMWYADMVHPFKQFGINDADDIPIVKFPKTVYSYLYSSLENLNIDAIRYICEQYNLKLLIDNPYISEALSDAISESFKQHCSLDFLNLIYEQNIKLIDILSEKEVYNICDKLINNMTSSFSYFKSNNKINPSITEERKNKILNNLSLSKDFNSFGYCQYHILFYLLEKENNVNLLNHVIQFLNDNGYTNLNKHVIRDCMKKFFNMIIENNNLFEDILVMLEEAENDALFKQFAKLVNDKLNNTQIMCIKQKIEKQEWLNMLNLKEEENKWYHKLFTFK